jgi:hypothetical protein
MLKMNFKFAFIACSKICSRWIFSRIYIINFKYLSDFGEFMQLNELILSGSALVIYAENSITQAKV